MSLRPTSGVRARRARSIMAAPCSSGISGKNTAPPALTNMSAATPTAAFAVRPDQRSDHFQPLGDRSAASPELLHGHIHNALVVVANMLLKDRYRALHAGLAATEVQVNRGGQIGMAQGVDQELIQDVHTAAVRQTAA